MNAAAVELALATLALTMATALRPWRALGVDGPPWPWVIAWAVLPLLWSLDRQLGVALLPPLSGAALLVLMTGWPLAVLACVPMAIVATLCGPLDAAAALHRAVWLGIVPATVALGLGTALRQWLPRHVAVYVMSRGFFCAGLAAMLAGVLGGAGIACMPDADAWVARALMALAEASITGGLVAVMVVQRPALLATYSDRLYLEHADAASARAPRERPLQELATQEPHHPTHRRRHARW
ncbi:MAG TPA: hypothetical protein VFK10_21510 [Burkholderiaceae bacterium]|nr:hypothetical protein [Burkholderiaceae bacterium]